MLTETWLYPQIKNKELHLSQYEVYRAERKLSKKGVSQHGGSLIGISTSIKQELIEISSLPVTIQESVVVAKCWSGMTCILLCCIYNPDAKSPYRIPADDLYLLFNFLSNLTFDLIFIAGDINFATTSWGLGYSPDPYEHAIVERLDELNYSQLINFPTTVTKTLDVLLTNKPEEVASIAEDVKLRQLHSLSNHKPVRFEISTPCTFQEQAPEHTLSFCKCDFEKLKNLIIENPFKPYCYSDINVMVELWYDWFLALIKECTPIRSQHRRSMPPWITSETSNRLNRLKTLRKKYSMRPTEHLSLKISKENSLCKEMEDTDLAMYESKLFSTRNTQGIFKYFKSLRGSGLPTVLRWKAIKAFEDYDKAELFNSYFSSVLNPESAPFDLNSVHPISGVHPKLEITSKEIIDDMSSLSISKSRGPDSLPPVIFIMLKNVLEPSLRNIFKNMIRLMQFPDKWKQGVISPIYKGDGSRTDVEKYRPVTLLNIAPKLFERPLYRYLFNIFKSHCAPSQHGFLPRRSAILQLLAWLDIVYKSYSNSEAAIGLCYLDFSKAFDKIDHQILLKKVAMLGVSRGFLGILQSYLKGRVQSVRVNKSLSTPKPVTSGVPQGSILGPLLFLIYINDLPDSIFYSTCFSFADDLKLYFIEQNKDLSLLQIDLNGLQNWSHCNKVYFNLSKCLFLNIRNCFEEMLIDDEVLKSPNNVKDLGLITNSKLTWTDHIEYRITKARCFYQFCRRNTSKNLSKFNKLDLYKSNILPISLYASECWSPSKSDLRLLENFNRKLLKWITPDKSYREALSYLNVLPIPYFKVLKDFMTLSSVLNGKFDSDVSSFVDINQQSRDGPFVLPTIKYELQRSNYWYRTCYRANLIWNKVYFWQPEGLKGRILNLMWKLFSKTYHENSTCTWTFICLCNFCRLRNPISEFEN